MSVEQIHHQEVKQKRTESGWTLVEVNGLPHVHTPGREELDLFAPPLQRLEAILREIDDIERTMQRGETSEVLSIKHNVLSIEAEWLTAFCVDAGLLPETIQ